MSLSVPHLYVLLCQTLDHMSPLDTGIFVLFTSFASYQCFHHLEPRSKWPLTTLVFVVPLLLSIPISYHVPWPPVAVLLAFLIHGSAVISFAIMYRLSPFHPLAKYPGPTLAKISKLWVAYICTKGNLHRYLKSLHDRYGDVDQTSSQFEIPHSYTRYLGKEAFPRVHAGRVVRDRRR